MATPLAARDIPVLITGESGTGKELIARAIHQHSERRDRRFVAINCGAIPEALLESELFGHRKGAFTGADRDHKGLLETADGGTLFLDEVGTLPRNVQKTLLRFLQDQEFYRVGDTNPKRVDVRVLSATNLDLQAAVQTGDFREDLYYRLNVINLHLPPLRERRVDIPLLVAHFIKEQNVRFGTQVKGFTPQAMEGLCQYDWQGNVRQLSNVVQAAMAIDGSEFIGREVVAQFIELPEGRAEPSGDRDELDYAAALARFETEYLDSLLRKTGGVVEEVAHHAGMNVATIYRKMKKYGLR
jgi:transcriptional regulator with PAS, ATPase and Fis domain